MTNGFSGCCGGFRVLVSEARPYARRNMTPYSRKIAADNATVAVNAIAHEDPNVACRTTTDSTASTVVKSNIQRIENRGSSMGLHHFVEGSHLLSHGTIDCDSFPS